MDRFVPGIYDSKNLYEILIILFTDEEAKLCSVMPLNYVSVKKMAEIWNKTEKEAEAVLDNLARKPPPRSRPMRGPRQVFRGLARDLNPGSAGLVAECQKDRHVNTTPPRSATCVPIA